MEIQGVATEMQLRPSLAALSSRVMFGLPSANAKTLDCCKGGA